jgi:hypothetical protein
VTFAALGTARRSGRLVFLAEAEQLEQLPRLISLPCPRFLLLLAYDEDRTAIRLSTTLGELLAAGCVYFCAWGRGCEHVHDTMDDVVLAKALSGRRGLNVITTWHAGEPLEETVAFALDRAMPDEAHAAGCDAIVLAAVNAPGWAAMFRGAAGRHLTESRTAESHRDGAPA